MVFSSFTQESLEIDFFVNIKLKKAVYIPITDSGLYQLKIGNRIVNLPLKALKLLNFRRFHGVVVDTLSLVNEKSSSVLR